MLIAIRSLITIKSGSALLWLSLKAFLLLLLLCSRIAAQEVTLALQNPSFQEGTLSTCEGGVLTSEGLRIQARTIRYTHQEEEGGTHCLHAEGDLLCEYGHQVFIAQSLDYDFHTHTGRLTHGRSAMGAWYVGGEEIELCADGSYHIHQGYLTTCENQQSTWRLRAREVHLYPAGFLNARGVYLQLARAPAIRLPNFQTRLDSLHDSPWQVRLQSRGWTGAVVGARYRFLDRGAFRAYFRGDYFWGRGPGAGIETRYCPANSCRQLVTQNYVARDFLVLEDRNQWRYRVAGIYHDSFNRGRYNAAASWDWLSDEEMPIDFRADDFNLRTGRRTQGSLNLRDPSYIAHLRITPRLNTFQTANQRLPEIRLYTHPRELLKSGVIGESRLIASHLNYVFARPTSNPDSGLARGFQSGRLEVDGLLYRPVCLAGIAAQPQIGLTAIAYSHGSHQGPSWLLVARAGADATLRLSKCTPTMFHAFEPYLNYRYYAPPTTQGAVYPTQNASTLPPGHYIFSAEDGYTELNQCRIGIRQFLLSKRPNSLCHQLTLDTYAYLFFHHSHIPGTLPRLYSTMWWRPTSTVEWSLEGAWNISHRQPDHALTRIGWTVSEHIACRLEYRYRSPYAWRKANSESFFVDTFHPESTLLTSSLSNRYQMILAHVFFRPVPTLGIELQSRHSWSRRLGQQNEPPFNEYRVSLEALLPCQFMLKAFFEHNQYNNRYGATLSLGSAFHGCRSSQAAVW